MIRKLDAESVRLLGSTEVVVSPASVVKELVENALDSCASRIAIKLEDIGLGSIEVSDNGCGIPKESMMLIGERHCTSKAKSAADLVEGKVETYGFRGEALASIATVAGQLSIATCCPDEAQGRRYVFDLGTHRFNTTPSVVAMQSGTIITVSGLFIKLPVRRDYYAKSKPRCRETLAQCRQIVAALSLCRLNCRFSLKHVGNATSLWETSPGFTVLTVLALIAGPLVSASDFQLLKVDNFLEGHGLECYLPPASKCSRDRQSLLFRNSADSFFICVNNRPIQDKDLAGAVKASYTECGLLTKSAFPIGCLKLTVPRQMIDANVDVAKQHVFFGTGKEAILDAVKSAVTNFLSSNNRSVNNLTENEHTEEDREDVAIVGDREDDEPIRKRSRQGDHEANSDYVKQYRFDADQWSRGRALGDDQQPVQLLMPPVNSPRRQKQSTWAASLIQLQQRRQRAELIPSDSEPPPIAQITEPNEEATMVEEEEIEMGPSLSERLSKAFSARSGGKNLKRRMLIGEELKALITSRPSHQVASGVGSRGWLVHLRMFLTTKPSEQVNKEFEQVGRTGTPGQPSKQVLFLLDTKSWNKPGEDARRRLRNSLIGCSLRRLSEAALFASMMSSAQLSKRNLGHNFSLGRFLTAEQLQFLSNLPAKPSNPPLFNTITDTRLVANGFKLRVYSTAQSSCYVEVEQSPELPEPYSLTTPNVIGPIVAEVVDAMMVQNNNSNNSKMASCRPGIVIDYLRSEVDRLLKLKLPNENDKDGANSSNEDEFLSQILASSNDRTSLLSIQCPHGKPLFYCPI